MGFGLTRDEVWELIQQNISTDVLVKHCLATEVIMRALAERLGEDPEALRSDPTIAYCVRRRPFPLRWENRKTVLAVRAAGTSERTHSSYQS